VAFDACHQVGCWYGFGVRSHAERIGGPGRNRTGIGGFAVPSITTLPPDQELRTGHIQAGRYPRKCSSRCNGLANKFMAGIDTALWLVSCCIRRCVANTLKTFSKCLASRICSPLHHHSATEPPQAASRRPLGAGGRGLSGERRVAVKPAMRFCNAAGSMTASQAVEQAMRLCDLRGCRYKARV
jgi:hypothetical protein